MSMPAQRGDEAKLFERHGQQLVRMVQGRTGVRRDVAEDACAFAWVQLLRRQPEREAILGWLFVVALNEARRRLRAPVECEFAETNLSARPYGACLQDLDATIEAHEALEEIACLGEQKVRIFSLHLAGLTYEEISAATGYSARQVDRHTVPARARVRQRCSGAQDAEPRARNGR